jgi:hypothetical protein
VFDIKQFELDTVLLNPETTVEDLTKIVMALYEENKELKERLERGA